MSTLAFLAAATLATPCTDLRSALDATLMEESEPEALWSLARMASRRGLEALADRYARSGGAVAISVPVAMGLGRRHEALRLLLEAAPVAAEAKLGQSLGLLALGDASRTATIAAALEGERLSAHRPLIASALARMPATKPRSLSYPLLLDPDVEVRLAVAPLHLLRGSRRARTALLQAALEGGPPRAVLATRVLLDAGHRFSRAELIRLPEAVGAEAVARHVDRGVDAIDFVTADRSELRVGGLAGALRTGRLPPSAMVSRLRRRGRDDVHAAGELAMARVLLGDLPSTALTALPRGSVRGAVALLSAFSTPKTPYLARRSVQALAVVLEAWVADARISAEDRARAIRALGALNASAALEVARRGLGAEPLVALASAEVVGRAGRDSDVVALLALARRLEGAERAETLTRAWSVCRK